MKNCIVGEKILKAAAATNSDSVSVSTGLRPYLSETGPNRNSPAASPIMPAVRPNCTVEAVHPKKFVMEGREGRYISLTNEANALIPARYMMKNVKCMPSEAAIGDCGPPWPAGCAVPAPGTEDAAPGAEVKVPGFEADADVFFIDAIEAVSK